MEEEEEEEELLKEPGIDEDEEIQSLNYNLIFHLIVAEENK